MTISPIRSNLAILVSSRSHAQAPARGMLLEQVAVEMLGWAAERLVAVELLGPAVCPVREGRSPTRVERLAVVAWRGRVARQPPADSRAPLGCLAPLVCQARVGLSEIDCRTTSLGST